ncbi:hypothetical protein [Rhodococcus sp. NCIMB 12038]|uniref:DUF7701 domain-containing protein n=1 Tax=Rhodococcus sp. NCIMB 12038 TaxID=933800 RepID=UPI000B3BFE18|nr:hypothetical protein [Rhodococcus sp. NCIMB 12038]OUS84916.1 hypothetical protein CA951_39770 [Rhodococcus sp. NCIMB 12038]
MNYIDRVAAMIEDTLDPSYRPDTHGADLYRLYAILALGQGINTRLADVHNAWSVWMITQNPEHPAIVPFDELSEEKQSEDAPFLDAIREVSSQLAHE